MKKLVISSFVALTIFASCSSTSGVSKKGHWNAEDKAKADAAMAAAEADLAIFGDKKDAFIDCYLVKLENAYSSYASADSDIQGCSSIAEECANPVLGMY